MIMRNDVPKSVINTNEENWTFVNFFINHDRIIILLGIKIYKKRVNVYDIK